MLGYWVDPLHPAASRAAGAPCRHLRLRPSMKIFARVGRPALFFALVVGLALPACGSKESQSAPAQGQSNRPTEWNVVIAEQTGGADPLSEYGTNAQYQLPIHVLEPLMHVEMLPDGSAWGVVNDLADHWAFPNATTFEV